MSFAIEYKDYIFKTMETHPEMSPKEVALFAMELAKTLDLYDTKVITLPSSTNSTEQPTGTSDDKADDKKSKKPFTPRHYARKDMKVAPEDSITEDYITCVICGRQMHSIDARHLRTHKTTPDQYRKDCSFNANQMLCSKKLQEYKLTKINEARDARGGGKSATAKDSKDVKDEAVKS